MGIKTEFRWSVNHPSAIGTKIRVYSLNQHHWAICWGILERRAQRRERLEAGESEIAGSPAGVSFVETAGDLQPQVPETATTAPNGDLESVAQELQPDLPYFWQSDQATG